MSLLPIMADGDDEISAKEAFEKEMMIIHHVGCHQHIIGLFGVCIKSSKLSQQLTAGSTLLTYRQIFVSDGVSL